MILFVYIISCFLSFVFFMVIKNIYTQRVSKFKILAKAGVRNVKEAGRFRSNPCDTQGWCRKFQISECGIQTKNQFLSLLVYLHKWIQKLVFSEAGVRNLKLPEFSLRNRLIITSDLLTSLAWRWNWDKRLSELIFYIKILNS